MSKLFEVDEFGVDPLSSPFFDLVPSVTAYTLYKIPAAEHFNPALTAFLKYKSKNWWQAILVYNGMGDLWEYTEGKMIRLPDINEMTTLLMRRLSVQPERTVTI